MRCLSSLTERRAEHPCTIGGMQTHCQLGILVWLSLAMNACSSKSSMVHPRDGAAGQDQGGGPGGTGNGGTDGRLGGDGGVARDTDQIDGGTDTFAEALDGGPSLDVSDAVADDAGASDGRIVIDLQPIDIGSGESGAATCGAVGSACTGQTGCSSGDDVDIGCRSFLVCQSGTFRAAHLTARCGATSGSACPDVQPTNGAACAQSPQVCSYSTGTCTCATGCESPVDAGPCQKPTTWHCVSTPMTGCPIQAPQLGVPCSSDRALCQYGSSCLQYEVQCQGGYWQPYGYLWSGGCA
jgi:hypothetical protein